MELCVCVRACVHCCAMQPDKQQCNTHGALFVCVLLAVHCNLMSSSTIPMELHTSSNTSTLPLLRFCWRASSDLELPVGRPWEKHLFRYQSVQSYLFTPTLPKWGRNSIQY
jgi:hypothetical protein